MSGDMLGEQDAATVSGDGSNTTSKRYRRELVCYRDTDKAEGVCGECGRPVCGPIMDTSVNGLLSSITSDHGHGRKLHDATFYHYKSGFKRVVLTAGLFGTALLFSFVFPGLISGVLSSIFSNPVGLEAAIVQSSLVLALAGLATLRYQKGERSTSLRIRVRETASRVFCDECFENRLVQLVLSYALNALVVIFVILGFRGLVAQGSALPLRFVALGFAVLLVRDDVVAYVMEILEPGDREEEMAATGQHGIESDDEGLRFDTEPDSLSDSQMTED